MREIKDEKTMTVLVAQEKFTFESRCEFASIDYFSHYFSPVLILTFLTDYCMKS
jgi:hypothetical protein